MAALDDLIDRLLSTRSQQELARTVAENIFSIDRKFWLRMATRSDTASTKADKERLQVLAEAVMTLVNAMVKRTEEQLEGGGKVLQQVLRAAADDNGEWYLPLAPEQVQRLRDCLDENAARLDEALLSNAFGYIRKCSEDGLDSMAQLIQKVLQLYAARQLRTSASEGIEGHINAVIFAEEKDWAPMLRSLAKSGDITEVTFMEALQRRMEHVVLGLQSGSYAQRVQAEYLKEVEARAKSVFRELASSQ